MEQAGAHSQSMASTLGTLETSLSIRRSLISEDSTSSRLTGRKCPSPEVNVKKCSSARETPVLSRSKTGAFGDESSGVWDSRFRWLALFVVMTLAAVLILSSRPLYEEWARSFSFRCEGVPFSSFSSPPAEGKDGRSFAREVSAETTQISWEEDERCWSRSRHLKYRPTETHSQHSPHLESALQKYASLHARCSSGGKKDWTMFTDMPNDSDCKYLIYLDGWEGLGNRLLSLASAFTYALATDRLLLIDDRKDLCSLLCEPFDGSSWRLPRSFPYEKVATLPTLDNVGQTGGEVGVLLNLRHEQSQGDQSFFCSETQEKLGKVRWVAWKSNQYYVTRLFMIPAFWEKLHPLFDDPSRAFTQLSRHMLLPKNAIWMKIERIYQAYLAPSQQIVGIQLRTVQEEHFSQHVHDRLMNCLLGDRILPNISQREDSYHHHNLGVASGGRIAIFVASLHREYYETLKETYMERGTDDGSVVSVHTVASDGAENQSYDQSVKALVDMWLLSFSDAVVTSAWSTFGYVAQGLGAVYPYIVNTDLHKSSSCYGGQSIDPCTHYPFLSDSTGHAICGEDRTRSVEHAEWIHKHLRACQDQPLGLQLIS